MTKIVLELEEAPDGTDDPVPSMLPDPAPSDLDPTLVESNFTYASDVPGPGGVVVRAEEALIVVLVLVLWVAAIALFFNRWGKIRMLEPYQPKFQQQHRQSCAIGEPNPLPHRACSKFNIHCADHAVHQTSCTSVFNRPRQNSVFVGSSVSLLPPQNTPRRAKSAFDLQSLVLAECTAQTHLDDDSAKPLKPNPAADAGVKPVGHFQRERGMSICHFDRTDVLARPLQRERGMSICNFDRTDVLVRPLQRERGMSICHFDRTDVLARPLARERGVSICHFDRTDVLARPQPPPPPPPPLHREGRFGVCNFERFDHASKLTQRERRMSVCNFDRVESLPKVSAHTKERGAASVCHFDRQTPSCSKTADALYNYKATCV